MVVSELFFVKYTSDGLDQHQKGLVIGASVFIRNLVVISNGGDIEHSPLRTAKQWEFCYFSVRFSRGSQVLDH